MNVNIPEKYADLYLKALAERKHNLEQKIDEFRREIMEIDNYIGSLTNMPMFGDHNTPANIDYTVKGYEANWPWTQKIIHFEEVKGKLFKSGEVVDYIVEKESTQDKSKVRSSISAALSNRLKSKKYSKFKDPISGNIYYGPSEWFLSNGNPQIHFVPDTLKEKLLKK